MRVDQLMRIHQLGWAPVKGTTWHTPERITLNHNGIHGDRAWSPVGDDLVCLKATDAPQLAGLRIDPVELPTPGGDEVTVTYWGRPFQATVHDGSLAQQISATVGRQLRLAHTQRQPGFIWSSPISVVLLSELAGLPVDARYRANIVVDDLAAPLKLGQGKRFSLGEVVLQVERQLDRCLVINHHPVTGERDADLLKLLPPGLMLGYGCAVVEPGELHVSTRT